MDSPQVEQQEQNVETRGAGRTATITVGLRPRPGYVPVRIQMDLSQDSARTLAELVEHLNGVHAQLQNGRHVDNHNDAVRWLLEQIEAAARIEPPPAAEPPGEKRRRTK